MPSGRPGYIGPYRAMGRMSETRESAACFVGKRPRRTAIARGPDPFRRRRCFGSIRFQSNDSKAQSGVIVAQGGSAVGYALYLKEGRLVFAVRRSSADITRIISAEIAAGWVAALAEVNRLTEHWPRLQFDEMVQSGVS